MSLHTQSALGLLSGFARREFSPLDVIDALTRRIADVEPRINALTTLGFERARDEACASERRYSRGDARALEGLPFVVKDLLDTADMRTTYGSGMFRSHVPKRDADAVEMLRRSGAILVGKASTHEFGFGVTTTNPHFGATRNPWDLTRIPGGSSGGSAAALAAFEVPVALGSDTGGSIRIPAAFCGVVGFKPTKGAVSTKGSFPLSASLDHIGPMARTPNDVALIFDALTGRAADRQREPGSRLRDGLRIGLRRGPEIDLVSTEALDAVDKACATLSGLGAIVAVAEVPQAARAYEEAFVPILLTEARQSHREAGLWPDRADEYGSDVRTRIERSTEVAFGRYLAAVEHRARLLEGYRRVFGQVDVLVSPIVLGPPPCIGDDSICHAGELLDVRRYAMSITAIENLVGLPACALRAGFDADGLPVGLQIVGPPGADHLVLHTAQVLFAATSFVQDRWPPTGKEELPATGSLAADDVPQAHKT
ncbi:amidase [Methylobacterium oxalidis]|uniref:amidase n=1 Tax=Methylobacterium oxalidis TaxID=944322 RepID=UPI003314F739